MSEPKFKVGDNVRLKAGGPTMTVEVVQLPRANMLEIGPDRITYSCAWYNGLNFVDRKFPEDCLIVQ